MVDGERRQSTVAPAIGLVQVRESLVLLAETCENGRHIEGKDEVPGRLSLQLRDYLKGLGSSARCIVSIAKRGKVFRIMGESDCILEFFNG